MNEERLLGLIERIAIVLERACPQKKLGFQSAPRAKYIFIGGDEPGSRWYCYDSNENRQLPIVADALVGTIEELRLTSKEYKGKPLVKLDVVIAGDQRYVLRSGLETFFARGLLSKLAILTEEQLKNPLSICPTSGKESVVFCDLYTSDGTSIFAEWEPSDNWLKMFHDIQARLRPLPKTLPTNTDTGQRLVAMTAQTDVEMHRLGWTADQGRLYLQTNYGKRSRALLTENELADFLHNLKSMEFQEQT